MKSLFEEAPLHEVLNRINEINANTQPTWGKMNAGQMMRHCQLPLEIALQKSTLPKPNPLMGLLFRAFKKSMYNDKLWKKNLRTAKEFVVDDQRDFEKEKGILIELINAFFNDRELKNRPPHPGFGHFTYDQWGQMQYKHLDHHLRQFGV